MNILDFDLDMGENLRVNKTIARASQNNTQHSLLLKNDNSISRKNIITIT